ncbi:MAG: AAA family ATPase [Egibacteraceae bacterium]
MDALLADLLSDFPAVLLVGPRATGKTTTAARLARTVIRLDRPAEAEAFRADPDVALAGVAEPILLDESQVVPEMLGAVKRAVGGSSWWWWYVQPLRTCGPAPAVCA